MKGYLRSSHVQSIYYTMKMYDQGASRQCMFRGGQSDSLLGSVSRRWIPLIKVVGTMTVTDPIEQRGSWTRLELH